MASFRSVGLVGSPGFLLVEISVCFSREFYYLFKTLFETESFQSSVNRFRRFLECGQHLAFRCSLTVELGDSAIEICSCERHCPVYKVSQNIIELCVDLAFELFPGEVQVFNFGPKADENVSPVL